MKNNFFNAIHGIAIIALVAIVGFGLLACGGGGGNDNGSNNVIFSLDKIDAMTFTLTVEGANWLVSDFYDDARNTYLYTEPWFLYALFSGEKTSDTVLTFTYSTEFYEDHFEYMETPVGTISLSGSDFNDFTKSHTTGGISINKGGGTTYSANPDKSSITFTALTVTYDGNGNNTGTVPTDSNLYTNGATVTVLGHGNLVKSGYTFDGWNTAADGSGTSYEADDTFTFTDTITLYAQWKSNFAVATFTAIPGDREIFLNWTVPVSSSFISGYQVTMDDWETIITKSTSERSHVFVDLTNGTLYTFKVRAVFSLAGFDDWVEEESSVTVAPSADSVTTPEAVATFIAAAGNGFVGLLWTAPVNNGGSAITGYEVTRDNWATTVTKAANEMSHVFYGLTNGTTYTFRVRALNMRGAGTESQENESPSASLSVPNNVIVSITGLTPGTRYYVSPEKNGLAWSFTYAQSHIADSSGTIYFAFSISYLILNGFTGDCRILYSDTTTLFSGFLSTGTYNMDAPIMHMLNAVNFTPR